MIYLDTHVVVWLSAGLQEKLTTAVAEKINRAVTVYISPIVLLELQYLYEINRLAEESQAVIEPLKSSIGLEVCPRPFPKVISRAIKIEWTRDPFDRLIVAHAALQNDTLLSKDHKIRMNYKHTLW